TSPGPPTRVNSPAVASATLTKCSTTCASAASNRPSGNGSSSALPTSASTPGNRCRTASTNCGAGSTAATCSTPRRRTSSVVSAPGPLPTSSAVCPASTPAASAKCAASRDEYRPMKRSYTSPETLKVLAPDSLSLIAMAKLYVGSSGFSYPSWKPDFYPAGTKAGDFLRTYSERLSTVELNTTGYRLPDEAQFRRWAEETPDGFRFAVKMPHPN